MIKRYATNPEHVEAVLFDTGTVSEAEKWCGGVAEHIQMDWDNPKILRLKVPTIEGTKYADLGKHYVVKDLSTGRFSVVEVVEFEAKFHQVGKRQDGLVFRNAPREKAPMGWGLNSDSP